jgi:hypothetical protein
MSSALAIASVTAVIKDLLENELVLWDVHGHLGDVFISALPPDRISTGTDERPRINLFMYRVSPQTGWRRMDDPIVTRDGGAPRSALALKLHYLISAYGEEDLQAEILLGNAIQLLHQRSVLTQAMLRDMLAPGDGDGHRQSMARTALQASTLANLVDEIHIRPEFLSFEDLTKLWSALQAKYRPSATYEASFVVIQADDVT